jgi:hypothetical protein
MTVRLPHGQDVYLNTLSEEEMAAEMDVSKKRHSFNGVKNPLAFPRPAGQMPRGIADPFFRTKKYQRSKVCGIGGPIADAEEFYQ